MKSLALLILAGSMAWAQVTISSCTFAGSGLNDATCGGRFVGPAANNQYVVTISATGTPDHFTWAKNGGAASAPAAITGAAQALADGVTITFAATTGHTVAANWTTTTTASGSLTAQRFIQTGVQAIFRDAQEKARETVSVRDFGAKGDGSTDDTAAIQRAINGANGRTLVFPANPPFCYKTTSRLTIGAYGQVVRGDGTYSSTPICYHGPTNDYGLVVRGFLAHISDLYIIDSGTGWASGIDYEGSRGEFDMVYVECNSQPGDGITAYKLGLAQSDQLNLLRPSIFDCTSGTGMKQFAANSLDINLYNPTIVNNWIGVQTYIGTNMNIFGGEISENYLNYLPVIGSNMFISGTRTELAKRQMWSQPGTGAAINFTYTGNQLSSYDPTRNAATATGTLGASTITLSALSYTFGDKITIAGAGPAGATLHATIISMASPTAATLDTNLGTSVTGAATALDATVQQCQFMGQGPGPWTYIGNDFNDGDVGQSFAAFLPPGFADAITFIGNGWGGQSLTPWGTLGPNAVAGVVMLNNRADVNGEFTGQTWMANVFGAGPSLSSTQSLNYIASETGANNAIIGASYIPITTGMEVTVLLAHSLRVGANTFNYNGHGADSIFGKTGANLTAARASGDLIRLVWTGSYWQDPTDTPGSGAPTYTIPTSYTPALTFGGGSTGITYSRQTGQYSQVCDSGAANCTTTVAIDLILTSKGSSTGSATISLPFTMSGGQPRAGCFLTWADVMSGLSGTVFGDIDPGTSTAQLKQTATGSLAALADTNFGNTSQISLTCVYRH